MRLRLAKCLVVTAVLLALLADDSSAWFRRRRRRCYRDCVWGAWGAWSPCSATCGEHGTKTRARSIAVSALCGGRACTGPSRETVACNRVCCPRNCQWHTWSPWSSCTATCGSSGTRSRTRNRTAEYCGGTPCNGSSSQVEACNRVCCPRNCQWGPWGSWGSCSVSCGTQTRAQVASSGTQTRTRSVLVPAYCGGSSCIGSDRDSKSCYGCCRVDCHWGDWGSWGNCTAPCGNSGTHTRRRRALISEYCGGTPCSASGYDSETSPCNRHCPHGTPNGASCICEDTGYSGTCCDNDIDECARDTHHCHQHANCTNTVGSYQCVCNSGYTGNGRTCTGTCSSGFEFWNGGCYFYSPRRNTFLSAESDCDSRGAKLVVVPDSATHQYLVQKASGKRNIWIGLSDSEQEGTFVWSNGVTLGSFHPWRGRNNARADCVAMSKFRRTYVWKVRGCSGKLNYFCQK